MIDRARVLLKSGEHEECFWTLKEHWLAKPEDIEAVRLLAELMDEVGKPELAEKLKKLCETDETFSSDAASMFEAGYQFIDDRQPELAALLLERCVKLAPDEPNVNYELGFALLSLKQYEKAIPYLDRAFLKIKDFDSYLNLAVAYTCTRQQQKLKKMLDGMAALASTDEESTELKHQRIVARRLELLSKKPVLTARDWLYIHYGSILLEQNDAPGSGGKFGPVDAGYMEIARTLLVLRGVLEGLGAEYDVIEYYSSLSRPLSHALAELLGVPYELYRGPNQEEHALLVMGWGSDIIGPHESFVALEKQRNIFSYALTWQEALPVTPELVGFLSEACALPWGERFIAEKWDDGRPITWERALKEPEGPAVSAQKILKAASNLEADPDVLNQVEKILTHYDRLKEYTLLGNDKIFSRRPEYTNEIPL